MSPPKATHTNIKCPCDSNLTYILCCEPYHTGEASPSTPEKLMRSRYSAYVLLLEDYLLYTWHSTTRPANLNLTHEAFTHPRKWLGLKVLHAEQLSLEKGIVEFIAKYKVNGKAHKIHEISDFVLENNQWFYVDGQFPSELNTDK